MKTLAGKIKSFFKKFNSFIIVAVAVIVCAASIVAGALYIRTMVTSLWNQIVSDIIEVTAQGGHSFDTFLQKEKESIEILADNLSQLDFSDESEKKEALDLLDMYSVEQGYFTLVVFDKDADSKKCTSYLALTAEEKQELAGKQRVGEEIDAEEYDYYAYAPGTIGITDAYYNRYTGQKTFAYYKVFKFNNGSGYKAVVRKGQILNDISDKFSLSFYENTGFSYVVKMNGDIVMRPTHKNSNRTAKNVFEVLSYDSENDNEINQIKKAMTENKAGAMLCTSGSEDKVVSFIPLADNDWYVLSVIPNSAVAANVENILQSSLALTAVIIVIVLMFSMFCVTTYFFRRRLASQEAEVKYREQLFGILANNTDDVFFMLPHGKKEAEYISPNIQRVMGFKEEDIKADLHLIGKPDNAADEDTPDYLGLDGIQNMQDGETLSYNSARKHKITGEQRYFHETVYRASIDGVDKDIIVFSDRTAEKIAESKLTEAMESANAASQAKSSFLSSMSHDIRTPMNAIVGMTSIAVKHIDDKERVKDCLNKITMSSNHLLTLINDVLDISKIESGKLNLSPVVFSLRDTVTNLVNIVRPQVTEKNLAFEIHVHGVEYEYLFADMLRVNQIFINILSNAVKYTPAGGKVIMSLTEEVLEKDKLVRLRYVVSDSGIGMSPEYMTHMYDTFSRAEDSRTNTIQGTGLGLAIVKQMVTLMGGSIDCDSELNKGTTFTVVIDLPVGEKSETEMKLPDITMLVVDDDEIFLDGVKDTVAELGATAYTASSGHQAIEMVKERNNYDVVIVDWKMPGMSGLDTIKEIRKILPKDTPIILVSAYEWEDIEEQAKHSGVDGFISKPLFRSYIYEKLCGVLRLNEKGENVQADKDDDLKGLSVLVAEDNDLNWEVISVLLDTYGVACQHAENGKVCVDMIEAAPEGTYNFILMDVQMPIMNGREATRAIRASKKDHVKNIPIIAMTADAFAEDIAACLDAGMNEHLAKPVDMDKLCQIIRRLLFGQNN